MGYVLTLLFIKHVMEQVKKEVEKDPELKKASESLGKAVLLSL